MWNYKWRVVIHHLTIKVADVTKFDQCLNMTDFKIIIIIIKKIKEQMKT